MFNVLLNVFNMKTPLIIIILIATLGMGLYYFLSLEGANSVPEKGMIVCFGDSITEGHRLRRVNSYPYQLGLSLGEEIINTGISGETSSEALVRLERDVLEKKPRLVIVQFGGNDPPCQIPLQATLKNNDLIVERILNAGAIPVLLIGEFNMLEPQYLEGFREIAERRGILLIEDAIDEIIKDSKFRLDDVHPNVGGQKILAQNIARAIKPLL
jgi:acyl-CoA thioesterase-1